MDTRELRALLEASTEWRVGEGQLWVEDAAGRLVLDGYDVSSVRLAVVAKNHMGKLLDVCEAAEAVQAAADSGVMTDSVRQRFRDALSTLAKGEL